MLTQPATQRRRAIAEVQSSGSHLARLSNGFCLSWVAGDDAPRRHPEDLDTRASHSASEEELIRLIDEAEQIVSGGNNNSSTSASSDSRSHALFEVTASSSTATCFINAVASAKAIGNFAAARGAGAVRHFRALS
jgi:hypothetical protein